MCRSQVNQKATYGNPKTTMQPEESISKNFEEIIPIIAKKGVGSRQFALAKRTQYKKNTKPELSSWQQRREGCF